MTENIDIIREFGECDKVNMGVSDADGMNALHVAVATGNTEIIEYIAQFSSIDVYQEFGGHTALAFAGSRGRLDIQKILLPRYEDYSKMSSATKSLVIATTQLLSILGN